MRNPQITRLNKEVKNTTECIKSNHSDYKSNHFTLLQLNQFNAKAWRRLAKFAEQQAKGCEDSVELLMRYEQQSA